MLGSRFNRGLRWFEDSGLAIVGAVSTLVILWLSASFWYEAYQLRKDSVRFTQGITLENTLSELSEALGHERATLLLDKPQPASTALGNQSGTPLTPADELTQQLNNTLQSFQLTHTTATVMLNQQIQRFEEYYQSVQHYNQESQPTNARVQGLASTDSNPNDAYAQRLAQYQLYSNLNEHLTAMVRSVDAAFFTNRNNEKVASVRDLRRSFWTLSTASTELEIQIDREMEALLRATASTSQAEQEVDAQAIFIKLAYHYHQIDADIEGLSKAVQAYHSEHPIRVKFDALSEWHNRYYKTTIERIISPSIKPRNNQALFTEWVNLRHARVAKHQDLWIDSSKLIQADAESLMSQATRNLTIDTALLLLCVLMGSYIGITVKQIKYRAEYDELTHLLNRPRFSYLLSSEIDRLGSDRSPLALVVINLPKYDEINETLGREHGDTLLKETASRLRGLAGNDLFVARYGEAQFTVLLSCKDQNDALVLGQDIHGQIGHPITVKERLFDMDMKVGIAMYPSHASDANELKNAADFALLQTKVDNQTSVELYDLAMAEKLRYRLEVESELLNAIEQDQLELHYQPQISTVENHSNRLEALIRWQHPERGFMSPIEFLSIAEQGGYMPLLGDWVMREAIRQCADWNGAKNSDPITVAVNVAADQFIQKNFVQTTLQYLEDYQLDSKYLEVEITESLLIQDIDQVTQALNELRMHGINIALDDFGTGYSSLSQLHTLPIDILKIDRAFVSRLDCPFKPSTTVTSTIIRMAKDYGLEIVAEGAETEAQVLTLNRMGADLIQGFFYSKPVPANDVISVLGSLNHALKYSKSA